jgi:hypothetical protein
VESFPAQILEHRKIQTLLIKKIASHFISRMP